jgi:O-antigen/teichoic acid export membrane protein
LSSLAREAAAAVFDVGHLTTDLKGRVVRGGVVTISAQAGRFALQTIGMIALARILTPADFGLVAMVTVLTGFVSLFKDAGLPQATIQRQEITHSQISALFWINVGLSAVLMLVTAAMAPAISWFYGEPRLRRVTLALAVTFLATGLTVQHDALLKRQMRFHALAAKDVISAAAGILVAVVLARAGAGYWALVAMPAVTTIIQMVLAWMMSPWRPGRPRRAPGVRSMLVFGGNLTGSQVIGYVDRNADNVLIGWYWGAGPLGLYATAYRLLMLPLTQLNAPIAAVAIPAFSRLQEDPERFARYYLGTISMIMWLSAPLFGFLFLAAEPVIVLTLGEQWRGAAPVFRILGICALTQPLYSTTGWLFVSRGRTDRLFRLGLLIAPVVVGSFVLGLPFGITGVALAYSLVLLAILAPVFHYTFRGTALTLKRFGGALLWPITLCVVAVAAAASAVHVIAPNGDMSRLLLIAVSFGVVYTSTGVLVAPVRREARSIRALLRELRPARLSS